MEIHPTRPEQEETEQAAPENTPRERVPRRGSRRQAIAVAALAAGLAAFSVGYAEQSHLERIETKESADTAEGLRDPEVLHRAEKIISSFENSTTEIKYDYAENLDDGRGITAGRAGFTSGTGDLLQVVQTYVNHGNENSPLAEYLQALKDIDKLSKSSESGMSDSVEGLEGFEEVWKATIVSETNIKEGNDEVYTLKEAQDEVYKTLYLNPALKRADNAGVTTAIGQTIVLDTIIQHGEGDDPDGLPNIVKETIDTAGTAKDQETAWLMTFLDVRKHHLENAADPETRDEWADSVDRVEALRSILKDNPSLTPPIKWTVYGDSFSTTK
jgi:chitosanase